MVLQPVLHPWGVWMGWDACVAMAPELAAGFSLTALEELVAENERLAAACQQPQQLEARLAQLQLENDALRAQLQQSEGLRRKGVHALLGLQQVRRLGIQPGAGLQHAPSGNCLPWCRLFALVSAAGCRQGDAGVQHLPSPCAGHLHHTHPACPPPTQEFDMLSKELQACPMPGAAPHMERTPAAGGKLYTPVAVADGLLSQTT